jgi:hypothetical protein
VNAIDGEPERAEPEAAEATEVARLRRLAMALASAQVALIAASIAGLVFLIDEPRTDDMRKLAVIAALAGLIGGCTAGLVVITGSVGQGFVLSDGTSVLWGRQAAFHADEVRNWERRQAAREGRGEGQRDAAEEPRPQPRALGGWSVSDIPQMIVVPLIGAVLGVVVFAGVVGGFLVASAGTGTYSPAALIFIAFLGGFFSNKFFERLSAASDALFGTEERSRGGDRASGPPANDDRQRSQR